MHLEVQKPQVNRPHTEQLQIKCLLSLLLPEYIRLSYVPEPVILVYVLQQPKYFCLQNNTENVRDILICQNIQYFDMPNIIITFKETFLWCYINQSDPF